MNRLAFGVALFIVLTMVIPAPSSVFSSWIQPVIQDSKPLSEMKSPLSTPQSLFSLQSAAADYQSQFGSSGSGNGQFSTPVGMAMDSSGNIYIADRGNNRVEKFNSAGVYQSQFGSSGSGNGQFSHPTGIAIDSSGNIYVADFSNNRVEKFNSAGVYQSQFGSSGSGNGQFSGPLDIAIDSSGNIYVADDNNNRVEKFNSAGVYQSQFGSSGSGNGQFNLPYGLAIDSSNNIYVVDNSNFRVQKFNSAGVYQSQFGSFGSGNGQFGDPNFISIDTLGNLYVTDQGNNRVEKFNSTGGYLSQFGSVGTGNSQFENAGKTVIDSSGNIYVADINNNRIEKFSHFATYISQFGSAGTGNGQFVFPFGIAIDSSGNIYVVDYQINRVQKFNSAGVYQSQFGSSGSGNGQFSTPVGMAIDSSGNLYVADELNNRIEKFNSTGSYLSQFGSFGSGNGQFHFPTYITIDSSDNIYVVDQQNNRIEKFNSTGSYLSQFGSFGSGNGQFATPQGIAIDSSGNIYVVDRGNNRVEKFNSAGVYQSQFGSSGSGNGQFSTPVGMAIDSSGNLYVGDEDGRVEEFNSAGVYQSQFGSAGSGNGQFGIPYGIAIDSSGNIYVADESTSRRVEKFSTNTSVPVISINWPGLGNANNTQTVTFAGTSSDTSSAGINNVQVSIDNLPFVPANGTTSWSFTVHNLAKGSHSVTARVTDNAGNTNQVQTTFTVDNISPTLAISSPTNSATLTTSSFTVSGTASDVGTGLASVTWKIDSGSVSTASGTTNWSFTTPSLSNGVHTINVNATDLVGNPYATIISVTVNTSAPTSTPPLVSITSPTNAELLATSTVVITGTSSYPNGIASVQVSIDGGPFSAATNTGTGFSAWSFTTQALTNGAHTAIANATDNDGLSAVATIPFTTDEPASLVIGHSDFISGTSGANSTALYHEQSVAFDSSGNLWVADAGNNRILEYATPLVTGEAASVVIGQPNFTSNAPGATSTAINSTTGIAFDSSGNLWVADAGNSRVLEYTAPITTNEAASVVIGQPNFTSSTFGTTSTTLWFPHGIAFDSSGNLWVADGANARILEYTAPFTTGKAASVVIGHSDFTTRTAGANSTALSNEQNVAFDSSGNLWVADGANARILEYTAPFTTGKAASVVIGQPNFTSNAPGTNSTTVNGPAYIAFDSSGNLWVTDRSNNRILEYTAPFTTGKAASVVIGQANFTSSIQGTTSTTLSSPTGLAFDSSGNLWVGDFGNNRVLQYAPSFTVNTTVPPTPDFATSVINPASATQGATGSTTIQASSLNGFIGPVTLSFDPASVPVGVTPSFAKNPLDLQVGATNSTMLLLDVGPSVAPGTYTIKVNGTNGAVTHGTTFALTVNPSLPPGDYIINSTAVVAVQGSNAPSTANVTSVSGFSSPVTLSVSNLPSGVTGAFATNPITPAANGFVTSTLNLGIDPSAVPGNYVVDVTGTSGLATHSFGMNLTITPSVVAGVTPTVTQPVVLSDNVYQPNSAGGLQIYAPSAGTNTVQVLVRSSSDPAGMLVTLPLTSTGMYTTTNQITFSSTSTDDLSVLHALTGDTIFVQYPPGQTSFLLSNTMFSGATTTGTINENMTLSSTSSGDIPIVGDWNGDGKWTPGIYRPSTSKFILTDSIGNVTGAPATEKIYFGQTGDIPIVGDWDDNGATDIGVFRPSTGQFLLSTTHGLDANNIFGTINENMTLSSTSSGDIPIVGDWNGDGKWTPGIYRPSTSKFILTDSIGNVTGAPATEKIYFGQTGDIPIVGDWDDNGATDIGVFRPSTGQFLLSTTHGLDANNIFGTTFEIINLGRNGDIPLAGNWDGLNHQTKVGIARLINSATATTASVITNQIPTAGATVSYVNNLDCAKDSSLDGICDKWKNNPNQPQYYNAALPAGVNIPINGIIYNFACDPAATYTSDPLGDKICPAVGTKDIYVEIDYMVGQQPDTSALTQVVNAFLTHQIHLHLLVDENMGLHYDNIPLTTTLNSDGSINQVGYFGASGSQGYKQGLKDMFFGTPTERTNVNANDLLTAKRQFYHYAMFVYELTTPGGTSGQSGYGEIGGNDIIISLGSFTNHVGSTAEQAATFMHELGHNLGLDHGGPVTLQSTGQLVPDHSLNCKPNYPSIMNYLYQMPYLVSGRPLDFSEHSPTSTTITNTLNENSLSESSGMGESWVAQGWQAAIGGVDANNNYQSSLASFTGSDDFNHDNIISSSNYAKNIHTFNIPNCDINTNGPATSYATLNSYDDWDNLNLEFRQSQVFQNGFFTINDADPSGDDVKNINSLAVSSLASEIGSLPDSAFAPNWPPTMKSTLDTELVQVNDAIQAGNLIGTNSASDLLQNKILTQMTGSGTASTQTSASPYGVLITDPTYQQQVSATVNNIINALIIEGTPSTTDNLSPGAQNEVLTTNENTPLGITLNAADPRGLSLLVNITSTSHGTLSPVPTGNNLDFTGFSSITYVPDSNFVGSDQFTYQVKSVDGLGITHMSNLATVTINVMGPTTMTLSLPTSSVTVNMPTTVTVQVTGVSPSGTVSFTGDGTFTPSDTCTLDNGACSVSFTPSTPGQTNISASYAGDANNQLSSASGSFMVSQSSTTTQVQLSPSSVTVNMPTTVTAQVTGVSPSGTVSFTGDGTFTPSDTCTLDNGACSVSFTPSTPGQTNISASYAGDANNVPSSSHVNELTVSQQQTTTQVQLSSQTVPVGGTTIVTAQVSDYLPSETISFVSNSTGFFNSTTCVIQDNQCAVTYTPSAVGSGSHKITASYAGDANNAPSSSDAILGVTQTTSSESISVNPTSIQVGDSSIVAVTIDGVSPTGTITFSAPPNSGQFNSTTCSLNGSTCGVTFNALGLPGPVVITASYAGDANNQPVSSTSTLSITQASTTATVTLVPSSTQVESTTTVTAQVSGFLPSGTVSFTHDNTGSFNSTTCTVHNNQCTVTYTPSAVGSGSHKITASYAGDTNNAPSSGFSTLTVTKYNSVTSLSLNPASVVVGHASTVTVSLTGVSPSGTVSFTHDNTGSFNSTTCTVHNNQCTVTYTPSAVGSGSHKITASYAGDTNNAPSSSDAILGVTQTISSESLSLNPASVVVGHASTVTVSLTGVSPSGTVSFTHDNTGSFNSTTCTVHNNQCTVTYTPSAVGSGSHKITASYAGDTNNAPSSSDAILGVTQASTTTTVTLVPSSVPAGGTTTVTAQVSGFSPSGSVTFNAPSGTFSPNTCILDNNDACSVTYHSASSGQITITASYAGDTNNKQSSSNAVLNVAPLQDQKNNIASNIQDLESEITEKNVIKKLDRAALHVQKSAADNLWNADGNTLDLKKGKQVFNQEADSVNLLLKLIPKNTSDDWDMADPDDTDTHDQDLDSMKTNSVSSSTIHSLQTIINQLESIDSTLAQNQINVASSFLASLQSHNASPVLIQHVQQDINDANSFMQSAHSDLVSGNFHRAIYEYRKAWSSATDAVDLSGDNLKGYNLSEVNLQGINLSGANLQGANLQNANLQGEDLSNTNLQNANLQGANLQNANLKGDNLQGTSLQNANLQGANLQNANLKGDNLQGTSLQNANLQGANLQNTNLSGANLTGANLSGANLKGANISGAIGLH